VEGYDVVTTADESAGRVVAVVDDFLIVEQGHLRKTRHPVPIEFAHPRDAEQVVCLTVPKEVLQDAPTADGEDFDRQAVAEYYGLAEGYAAPETEGLGELEPHETAWSAEHESAAVEPAAKERAEIRESLRPEGRNEVFESPALLGERDAEVPKPKR